MDQRGARSYAAQSENAPRRFACYASIIRIGCRVRLKGFRIRPRISSVTTPKSASSSFSPDGVPYHCVGFEICYSDKGNKFSGTAETTGKVS
jgi:hypothetical protein